MTSPRPIKKDKHSVRPTRLGLHLIFIAVFTMVGGAIRGFNLLLLLSGLLVGVLLIQWRYSRWFAESIKVRRELASEAFAGTPFRVAFRIRNLSNWLPLWLIHVDEQIRPVDSDITTVGSCAAGAVNAKQEQIASFDCTIANRGEYEFGPTVAGSTFPFSLFCGRLKLRDHSSLLVFPKPLELRRGWQDMLLTQQGETAASARRVGLSNGDFFGLREWQPGDNVRWIHHRTTARAGEPIVRQFEQQLHIDANLLIDCYCNEESRNQDAPAEQAIRFATSVLMNHSAETASRISLTVADVEARVSTAGLSRKGKSDSLAFLAGAQLTQNPKIAETLDKVLRTGGESKHLIVVSPRSLESVFRQSDDAAVCERLQIWIRRRALNWIDVTSDEFQSWVLPDVTH